MKRQGAYLLVATMLAASIALPSLADEKTASEPAPPSQADLKNSTKRGIMIKLVEPKGIEKKPAEKKPTAQESKPKTTHVTVNKPAKSDEAKTAKTAVQSKPAIKNVSTTKVVTAKTPEKRESNVTKHTTAPKTSVATKTTTQAKPQVAHDEDQIVSAWLNKSGKPHYKDGEKLQVNVSANKDCNVLIFNYDGSMLTQLFPNDFQLSPLVKAGQTVEIGGEHSKFDFVANNDKPKASNEKIFVYAYPVDSDSSPISVAMAPIPETPFRGTELTPEQYRDMVNQSKGFTARSVKVQGKNKGTTQLVSYTQSNDSAPNKVELSLVIDALNK